MEGEKKIASPILLNAKVKKEIDRWIAKFPVDKKSSAVIPALKIVQQENGGYLTNSLMDAVANYLEMPKIAVYEVVTFYSMFEREPVGKYKICVCTNISCMLNDSDGIVNHLRQKLDIELGETTKDGRYTLKEVECLGACGGAPMMQIGNTYYENLTPEKVDGILNQLDSTT